MSQTQATHRVLIYGTLLPGERNHHYLAPCELLGPAQTAPGFGLYDLGVFPALVAGGSGQVSGELYAISPARLVWLDRLEQSPEWYRRTPIELDSGAPAEAYLLPRADLPADGVRIPGGAWPAWARGKPSVHLTRREELDTRHSWRPIAGCPGRSVLRNGDPNLGPEQLLGSATLVRSFRVPATPDEVHVALLPDGGLISYRRPDETWVHTLNTPSGLARKLAQLAIATH